MHSRSPSVDRIGAALKALRQTHVHDLHPEDELSFGVKCLHVVTAQLKEEGLPKEDLQPLIDLEARLRQTLAPAQKTAPNRRKRRAPSEALLARTSALIDLLIKGGSREAEAAQLVMRRLMAAGIPPPKKGGDARGWKRLLEWRTKLGNGLVSDAARQEYLDFTREIEAIPPAERVQRVLDRRVWDRRRKAR
jgi:hypothetical protein